MTKDPHAPPLWTAAEAAAATGGQAEGDWRAAGLAIDTRDLAPGDLFVALQAARDGHDFVGDAFAQGAAAALVARPREGGPLLLVDDTQRALEALGEARRDQVAAYRVAVTGSVGKTSVKELIAVILRAAGPAHQSVKSYNNHWGVPLSLARMPKTSQRAVFELGMSAAGEIRALSAQVRPHCAMVTRIAPAHLAFFRDIGAIAAAKAEIYESLTSDGTAIAPGAEIDEFGDYLAEQARRSGARKIWRYGHAPGLEARLLEFTATGEEGHGTAEILGARVRFRTPNAGEHWGLNAVLALLAGAAAGAPPALGAEAISDGFVLPEGRGAAVDRPCPAGGRFTLIDDSYNANPVSMRAALQALGQRRGRKLAALGEMRELGERSAELHSGLAAEFAGIDQLFLAGGPVWDAAWRDLAGDKRGARAESADGLIEPILSSLRDGDVLLVKGSNASGMKRIVAHFRAKEPGE